MFSLSSETGRCTETFPLEGLWLLKAVPVLRLAVQVILLVATSFASLYVLIEYVLDKQDHQLCTFIQ